LHGSHPSWMLRCALGDLINHFLIGT
jgi:hypothetical protein